MTTASRRAAVIGGGITGTLVSNALLKAGWNVVLLEAAHVGAGSSSRTAAGIRQQFSTQETVVGMQYSVSFYRRWEEEMGAEGSPLHQNGYLFLHRESAAWEEAKRRVEAQRSWGLGDIQALDSEAISDRFPVVSEEGLVGATWCPSDGFLRPEMVYNDAAEAARRGGVSLLQRAPVLEARSTGGRLVGVRTPKGWVEADLFLDCTNAWTVRIGELLEATALPVAALKRYLWFLDRGEAFSEEDLLSLPMVVAPGGAYCRPENGGSLMMGWAQQTRDEAREFSHEDQDTVLPDFYHRSGVEARPFEAWLALAEVLPVLEEFAGLTATTAGFYGTTPDHNPFLDFDSQVPNLVRLVGFSGHGAMFGPFTAAVAVALAEAGHSLDSIPLPTGRVKLDAFRIGRSMSNHENMVI